MNLRRLLLRCRFWKPPPHRAAITILLRPGNLTRAPHLVRDNIHSTVQLGWSQITPRVPTVITGIQWILTGLVTGGFLRMVMTTTQMHRLLMGTDARVMAVPTMSATILKTPAIGATTKRTIINTLVARILGTTEMVRVVGVIGIR